MKRTKVQNQELPKEQDTDQKNTKEVDTLSASLELKTHIPKDPIEVLKGTVLNGITLNVRSNPSLSSDILSTIEGGQEVTIIGEYSNFYKVVTDFNLEGYCMKNYITLK